MIEIYTWEDLNNIGNNSSESYILMNDLDSSSPGYDIYASSSANGGLGWHPSSFFFGSFLGVFDGGGHIIYDLRINVNHSVQCFNMGLFGQVYGTIKNVGVVDAIYDVEDNVGGIVGLLRGGGLVENCYFSGVINGHQAIGGIVGALINAGTIVRNCFASGSLIMAYGLTGGLVGIIGGYQNLGGQVINCFSKCLISTGKSNCGGLVGLNVNSVGTIVSSYYDSQISGLSDTGKGEPKTSAEMMNISTYNGWNIVENSDYQNDGYPFLSGLESPIWYIYKDIRKVNIGDGGILKIGEGGTLTV